MEFKLTTKEVSLFKSWLEEHDKICPIQYSGAIGERMTFCFSPTSLGTLSKVSCACGEQVLLTNTEDW